MASESIERAITLETTGEIEPLNLRAPQLTVRAILTGMVLGALLAPCNIYAGLKIGWAFNMSISAALLSYGFWQGLHAVAGTDRWGLLENNINQTAASGAASIASAGLVAPIPALALMTGEQLPYLYLSFWVFSVSLVGIVVAVGLRRQMLEVDKLPFPAGIATAGTIKEIYAKGKEAMARVRMLLAAGSLAGGLKIVSSFFYEIPKAAIPALSLPTVPPLKALGIKSISAKNLGFLLDPSLMMYGFGAIIGFRPCASLLLGTVVSWGLLAPWLLEIQWVVLTDVGAADIWFQPLVEWLLWPGVAMMVTASLTSFAFSWRSIAAAITGRGSGDDMPDRNAHEVPRSWFKWGLGVAAFFAVVTQMWFFDIDWWVAILAVLLTFGLAVVAGRVSGETGITPIGAMGQVTQFTFGVIAPGNATANLMSANVTGGAAGQCADMLHDLKTGLLIGASPRFQTIAQFFGVMAGSLSGTAAYLLLVPDPTALISEKWPAPAVAAWYAVAEVFASGFDALPPGTIGAMLIAGAIGIILAILEKVVPEDAEGYVPSAASIGLAFVIPAWNSISIFIGGFIALLITRYAKSWGDRFLIVGAAGLVAGESLAGVASAIAGLLGA